MSISLQRRLTLSHLAVTIISVAILVVFILVGYFIYLRSDLAAAWAGDFADYYAAELVYWVESEPGRMLDESLGLAFIDTVAYDLGYITAGDADWSEWLLIIDPDDLILASNFDDQYLPGDRLIDPLPGFDSTLPRTEMHYATISGGSVGQAPIMANGRFLGWVYYRFPDESNYLLSDTAVSVTAAAFGVGLIAVVVSGFVGNWLARSFAGRLEEVTRASAAFAAGDFNQRIAIQGQDAITELSQQFNQMADQISGQMQELRLLAEHNAQLTEEARALAALEERNRLARELHDAVKQQLFGLGLTAGSIRQLLDKDPARAQERLRKMNTHIQQIQLEMDTIIKQLRPAALGEGGLAEAIGTLCVEWEAQSAVPVKLTIQEARLLPLPVEHALLRVAQESLANVARHAQATGVTVNLNYEKTAVSLRIMDNGVGFDPAQPRSADSLGLVSMAHRLHTLNGRLTIQSQPGQATTVLAELPLPEVDHV